MNTSNQAQIANSLWSIAELLRGWVRASHYGRIILPFTLLRRLECVLEPTKLAVLNAAKKHQDKPALMREKLLLQEAKQQFYNSSPLTLGTLSDTQTANDLMSYVQSFSRDAREIFEHFRFEEFVKQLEASNLLHQVVQRFAGTDLSSQTISNFAMGLIFEALIRKFAESSNDAAGEYFTPRDVVRLTTSLLMTGQDDKLKPNSIVTIYDPAAGTGSFLSDGNEYIQEISKKVTVSLHGQELNPESYAICKADMLLKGQVVSNIKLGNTLSDDQLIGGHFDFMLSNPPFGVTWQKVKKQVTDEHELQRFDGRFGPGLPRVSDGSLLFLLHMVSKMRKPEDGGSRIGIILNGSPLFTGGAGSGESEIRRYLLHNDLVEAIVALPMDMFYYTGIATYVWVLSNHKPEPRRGKVQLIDGTQHFSKMRKSLGSKRHYLSEEQIEDLVGIYGRFEETSQSKIFPIEAFGYRRITIERPLQLAFQVTEERVRAALAGKQIQRLDGEKQSRLITALNGMDGASYLNRDRFMKALKTGLLAQDLELTASQLKTLLNNFGERNPDADICQSKGEPEPDTGLRDYEEVPLGESIYDYFDREVRPYFPDAWVDEDKRDAVDGEVGIVGIEIPFNRILYRQYIEELETQYSAYEEYPFKRLAVEVNEVYANDRFFTEKNNSVYIPKIFNLPVISEMPDKKSRHQHYFQVVLNDRAINEYVALFFKSALGDLILKSFGSGVQQYRLFRGDIKRLTVALPTLEIQEQVLSTHRKLSDLKKVIDSFDSELSLNPTDSNSVSEILDNMLKVIGGLSDSDRVLGLIRKGESKWLEFKETLALNVRTKDKDKRIIESALKTIVAFLNTEGGVLLIGVRDNGVVTGLTEEIEKFDKNSHDNFLLRFKDYLKKQIGVDFYPYIDYQLVKVNSKNILFVDCEPSERACFLGEVDFYIRTNPATEKLVGPKLFAYARKRFNSEVI